eukprot:1152934-Pelagomonas_calceolata.AAC.1
MKGKDTCCCFGNCMHAFELIHLAASQCGTGSTPPAAGQESPCTAACLANVRVWERYNCHMPHSCMLL